MAAKAVISEVKAWIQKAEADFQNIELVLPAKNAPFDTVCFHAQQAAKKYIKALLPFYGIPFGKSHDVDELLNLLPSKSKVRAAVGDLSELSDAAVMTRYPEDWDEEYDREIAERLVQQALMVKSAVMNELKQL